MDKFISQFPFQLVILRGMKSFTKIACLLALTLICSGVFAEPKDSSGVTFIIPINGMIERGLMYVIRRGVTQAEQENADAIIFDMDTPGGRLDAAEEIVNLIGGLDVKTITFVNPNAISAGAIIALATDEIYMAPGSRIGDAMPLMMSPIGSPQEMPEALEEKSVSYVASLIRSAAQRKGHDHQLAEAMVRRELEYKIGDDVICPEGQLLTLTNVEAERMVGDENDRHPLLSMGTVDNIDALLKKLGQENSSIVEFELTSAEKIARYIELFSVLFLAGGLLGIYIEFKTPGFGIPGIMGILLLAIWFWGHHVAGLAGMGELIIFAVGITLLFIELFVIPGFGIVGITGLTLIVISLAMAMVQHYPGGPWYPPAAQVAGSIKALGASLAITFILAGILAKFLPQTQMFHRLTLDTAIGADKGYHASNETNNLLGLRGSAATGLHPAGIGVFDGKRIDVIARGSFIDRGSPIVIAETHGNRIVVEPLVDDESRQAENKV